MKKKVTLTKVTKEEIEVEVEFPIYRKHDVSGDDYNSVIYQRIDGHREVSIHKTERYRSSGEVEWRIEIEDGHSVRGENVDYALGRGEYASSAEAFNKVLAELRQFLAGL